MPYLKFQWRFAVISYDMKLENFLDL